MSSASKIIIYKMKGCLKVKKTICLSLAIAMLFGITAIGISAENNVKQISLADIAFSDAASLTDATQMMIWKMGSDSGMRTLSKDKMNEFLTQFEERFPITAR